MNKQHHQVIVQGAVKAKFKGSEPLVSKVKPTYPESAEREYRRIANGYVKLLNDTIKAHLPKIFELYKRERKDDEHFDDMRDLDSEVRRELQKASEELEQKIASYGLDNFIRKIATLTKNKSINEWKRVVRQTLGIDLFDDYYKGDFYEQALKQWIDENVAKIRSIPSESLNSMNDIILKGFARGESITTITKAIQSECKVSKNKAKALARDQLATLNSQITKLQQKDAGCSKYKWSSSRDSRVRDCHRALNGQIFSWDDPPEMWYETKSRGRVYTGRHCHPGEDYLCRCIAIPVFDYDTVDVPMKPSGN